MHVIESQLLANIFLRGKIECLTGLHVGGSQTKFEIGGVDNPVIRDPITRYLYIPGTSLKGKLRMLLEYHLGKVHEKGHPSEDEEITTLFGIGASANKKSDPVRLIFRDAYPDEPTKQLWKSLDSELLYTEYKPENTIDRLTSHANPPYMELVVKGSRFDIEIICSIYRIEGVTDNAERNLGYLKKAMILFEHSALGGSGSRGYGQIKFHMLEPSINKLKDKAVKERKSLGLRDQISDQKNFLSESKFKSLSELGFEKTCTELKSL